MARLANLQDGWFSTAVTRGRVSPFIEIAEITPERAAQMLEANTSNRKVKNSKLKQMTRDIKNGLWQLNGETIVVSDTGEINDGQHRLMAVIDADKSIHVAVAFGVSRDSRFTVDAGAARGAHDQLALMGVTNPNISAAAARFIISFELSNGESISKTNLISASEIIERVIADKRLADTVKWADSIPRVVAPGTITQLAFWKYLMKDDPRKNAFMEKVGFGENITRTDNAYLVRQRLLKMERIDGKKATEVFLRGLQAEMKGIKLQKLTTSGHFPKVR